MTKLDPTAFEAASVAYAEATSAGYRAATEHKTIADGITINEGAIRDAALTAAIAAYLAAVARGASLTPELSNG